MAKPTAAVLDWWPGEEGIGALNFLALDDIAVIQEGEHVDPGSVIRLPTKNGLPIFPQFERRALAPFPLEVNRSGKKWVIIVDEHDKPCMVLNANAFLQIPMLPRVTMISLRMAVALGCETSSCEMD